MNKLALAVLMMSGVAMAADLPAPQMGSTVKLSCAAGSKQVNDGEGIFCNRGGSVATERLEGPYVGLNKNGTVHSRGQYLAGGRTGHWVFFDEKGIKTHEIDFKNDNFDGQRVEFHPNGQKKAVEVYARGVLTAPVATFDQLGAPITVAR
ncbi:MAG: repeat-containing protein [Myxococcaceae bacterium]|nr:repeat-containing protein [Myxococcaceae bacterium]